MTQYLRGCACGKPSGFACSGLLRFDLPPAHNLRPRSPTKNPWFVFAVVATIRPTLPLPAWRRLQFFAAPRKLFWFCFNTCGNACGLGIRGSVRRGQKFTSIAVFHCNKRLFLWTPQNRIAVFRLFARKHKRYLQTLTRLSLES